MNPGVVDVDELIEFWTLLEIVPVSRDSTGFRRHCASVRAAA
jgi:hypothetical protein